jgi:hypothetical protein
MPAEARLYENHRVPGFSHGLPWGEGGERREPGEGLIPLGNPL